MWNEGLSYGPNIGTCRNGTPGEDSQAQVIQIARQEEAWVHQAQGQHGDRGIACEGPHNWQLSW